MWATQSEGVNGVGIAGKKALLGTIRKCKCHDRKRELGEKKLGIGNEL